MTDESGPKSPGARHGSEPSSTRELLRQLDASTTRRCASWTELVARVDQRLRILLRFELTAELRARSSEDDLLQETWAAALANWNRFEYRGRGSLQRWISGILRNKLREAQRSGRAARTVNAGPADEERPATSGAAPPRGLLDAVADRSSGATTILARAELTRSIAAAIERLPEAERIVVLRRFFEGQTGQEVAAALGIDESTVSVRLRRAFERLARELRGEQP